MKTIVCIVLTALLFGCGRTHPSSVGLNNLDEARVAADKFLIEASPSLFIRSADTCMMSKAQLDAATQFMTTGWKKATVRQHYRWTKMVDAAGYPEIEAEIQKDWPEWMKKNPPLWNHQPEKYLVYFFEEKEGDKGKAHIYFTVGIFRREGLWYFSSQYK